MAEPSTSDTAFSPASNLLATSAEAFLASSAFFTSCGLMETCEDRPAGAILSHQRYTPKPTTPRRMIVRRILPRVVICFSVQGDGSISSDSRCRLRSDEKPSPILDHPIAALVPYSAIFCFSVGLGVA